MAWEVAGALVVWEGKGQGVALKAVKPRPAADPQTITQEAAAAAVAHSSDVLEMAATAPTPTMVAARGLRAVPAEIRSHPHPDSVRGAAVVVEPAAGAFRRASMADAVADTSS